MLACLARDGRVQEGKPRRNKMITKGFVLASSAELVVLQYVYDFNLDGLMVLRVADITDIRWSATGRFGSANRNPSSCFVP